MALALSIVALTLGPVLVPVRNGAVCAGAPEPVILRS